MILKIGKTYVSRQHIVAGTLAAERRMIRPYACENGLVEFEILTGNRGRGVVYATDFERLYELESSTRERWDVRFARWLGEKILGRR